MDGNPSAEEIKAIHRCLDTVTYYEVLGLRPACDYLAVRDAFYDRAQRLHPDRFVASDDEELQQAVYAIYKRITEAYNVLLDPQLRVAYDAARVRGEVRLSDVARARRLSAEERQLSNPFARIYVRSAREKLERGEVRGAWVDVQLGLSLERSAPLEELAAAIAAHPEGADLPGANR